MTANDLLEFLYEQSPLVMNSPIIIKVDDKYLQVTTVKVVNYNDVILYTDENELQADTGFNDPTEK